MTMTVTRRKNLIKAIRKALLLSHGQASRVVDANWINLACIEDRPLHDMIIVVTQTTNSRGDWSGTASMYVDENDYIGFIDVPAGLMKPFLTASIARAYQLPDDLVEFYDAQWEADMRRPLDIPASPFGYDMAAFLAA